MNLSMGQIGEYLAKSREYINDAYNRASRMGVYCPYLDRLLTRQEELEREAWRASRQGLGWFLVAAVGSVAAYLGTYVYKQYADAKMQSDYLKCLETYTSQGISPEMAADICSGQYSTSQTTSNIEKNIKLVVYGAIAITALWFGSKIMSRVKK
jgi:hypothetical protein